MGVIQEITLLVSKASIAALNRQLDEASRTLQQTVEKAIDAGGADTKAKAAAVAKIRALKDELARESRALAAAVEQGLLGAKEAAQLGMDAGRAYGDAMAKELQRIQKAGVLSKTDLAVVAKQVGQQSGMGRSLFDLAPPDDAPFRGFFGRIKGMALGVGSAIAGVFALGKLKDFARDSIREFLKDASDLDNLRSTVQGLGLDFDRLRPEIQAASDAFVRAGRGSAGDFQRVLQQLTLTSGDYQKSLGNVMLVSDLAAARQISLEQATKLVGSAMIGEAGRLRQFGVEVAKGGDAVQALRDQVGGFVARQGLTWGRVIAGLTNGWSEFKSTLGEALLTAGGGTGTFDSLGAMVQSLTTIVRENAGVFRDVGKAIGEVVGFLAKDLVSSVRQAIQDITNMSAAWMKAEAAYARFEAKLSKAGAFLSSLRGDVGTAALQQAEAERLEQEAAGIDARVKALQARADREEQVNRGAQLFGGTESGASSSSASASATGGSVRGARTGTDGSGSPRKPDFGTIEIEHVSFEKGAGLAGGLKAAGQTDEIIQARLEDEDRKAKRAAEQRAKNILDIRRPSDDPMQQDIARDELGEKVDAFTEKAFGRDFKEMVEEAAGFLDDEFGAVFDRLFQDGDNLTSLFSNMGKGLAAGLIKEIAATAKFRAHENFASAIEETAKGVAAWFSPDKAAVHFAAAGKFLAAGAAWSALAGAAGSAGSALSQTGGAGSGAGGGDLGRGENERLQPGGRGQATIYITGGDWINFGDRRQLDQLARAMELVSDYDVVVKRGAA